MKQGISIILLILHIHVYATNQYVAAKSGLALREQPSILAKESSKIAYGTLIHTTELDTATYIVVDNIKGKWLKTTYKGKEGYIASCYLLNIPPPSIHTKTFKEYFNQLSTIKCTIAKKNTSKIDDDKFYELHKTIYNNSYEIHDARFYEADEQCYFITDISIEQAYILCTLIEETSSAFSKIKVLPTEDIKTKEPSEVNDYVVTLKKYDEENVYEIHIEYELEIYHFLDIKTIAGQIVISVGSGV